MKIHGALVILQQTCPKLFMLPILKARPDKAMATVLLHFYYHYYYKVDFN